MIRKVNSFVLPNQWTIAAPVATIDIISLWLHWVYFYNWQTAALASEKKIILSSQHRVEQSKMIRKVKLASFSFPFCVATPIIMDHLSSCGYSGYNFFVATLGTLFYLRTAAYASK